MTLSTINHETKLEMAFNEWTTQQLKRTFNLTTLDNCPQLEAWLNKPYQTSKKEQDFAEGLRKLAIKKVAFWNEEELKLHFLFPLLSSINYNTLTYSAFAERTISVDIDAYRMNGKVDLMVASGEYEPINPYFFFHEYKREKGGADDPIGQLLAAMLVGQTLNDDGKPIYGSYVIGRNWFFVVLQGKEYCISEEFVSTRQQDLMQIVSALNNIKLIIEEVLN